jgi:hypothetical protein
MRFGVDGTGWALTAQVLVCSSKPRDHHLCMNAQPKLQSVVNSSTAAISFTTEAGKAYYFPTKSPS